MNKLKIVADENIPSVHAFFDCFGDVQTYPGRSLSFNQVKDADILLIRSVTTVNEALLKGSKVKFVGTCTIGIDHLDTAYLKANKIVFANAPGCNADGVVQYDLTALAKVDKDWQSRKVGIIGCGNVGGRLLKAMQALSMDCVVYDPFLSQEQNSDLTSLERVLTRDIICMHAPYTKTGPFPSHHMINHSALKQMRDGTILLNAGRGGTIDNHALLLHLKNGADLQVILDVWEKEPNVNVELMHRVKIATSHIAGYGFEGKLNGSAMIFESLLSFLNANTLLSRTKSFEEYQQYCNRLMKTLNGPSEVIRESSINTALAATYDIGADDKRFRVAINQAGESCDAVAKAFDQLRKSYPTRRELGHFIASSDDAGVNRALVGLGFLCGD